MNDQKILKEQLRTVNRSIFYLILTVLSVLLSLWPVLMQREQLEEMLAGVPQKTAAPDAFPIRLNAAAVAVSALGFFFCQSLRTCRDASHTKDFAAQKSAGMNAWASLFALAAALIHIYDLVFVEEAQHYLTEKNIPTALAQTEQLQDISIV